MRRVSETKAGIEGLRSPLFQAYHDGQPFNNNMFQPCPMLENPHKLRDMIEKTGAKSTDLQSPESAEHLCGNAIIMRSAGRARRNSYGTRSPKNAKRMYWSITLNDSLFYV